MRSAVNYKSSMVQLAMLLMCLLACWHNCVAQIAVSESLESFCNVESSVEGLPVFGEMYKYHEDGHLLPKSRTIPIEPPLVNVRIQGKDYVFLLHIESNFTMFDDNSFPAEMFTVDSSDAEVTSVLKPKHVVKVNTLDGSVGCFKLNFCGNEVSALLPFAEDDCEDCNDRPTGSIGMCFLRDKQLFSSMERRAFAVLSNARPASSRWRSAIACEASEDGLQHIVVRISEHGYKVALTSASNSTDIGLEYSAFKKHLDEGKIREVKLRTCHTVAGHFQVLQGILDQIEVGCLQIKDVVAWSAPDGAGNSISLAAFRDTDVLFDVENKKLYLSKER